MDTRPAPFNLTRNLAPQGAPLPEPDTAARDASVLLCQHIVDAIAAAGGWIPFTRFMELALYAPGLGYYSGGAQKFGAAGDFVTAPEISPLFAQTLATPAAAIMAQSAAHILEAGAGTGLLAADLLLELERTGQLPEHYTILELSGELRARQHATLAARVPHLLERITWLDSLPEKFSGLVLGNEVLDAMPVALVQWMPDGEILENGIHLDAQQHFAWSQRPASGALLEAARQRPPAHDLTEPYLSEINLAAAAWVGEWGRILERGALLLIDYGFPRSEYYLPQRNQGTLMCHYRHHAHDNPLWWPGLNDITSHVDFSTIADAGFNVGLDVLGYTSQARFLLECGITRALERIPNDGGRAYLSAARSVEKLILPHEMGELFKVIAFGRNLTQTMPGFASGDRLHTL
jgi:SAM-dependent MidA family methyltransferase